MRFPSSHASMKITWLEFLLFIVTVLTIPMQVRCCHIQYNLVHYELVMNFYIQYLLFVLQ